jgi:hypothetical protein
MRVKKFNVRCCMCTCIVSLTAQVRLICSANGYANGYRYGDEYGYGYGSQVCIYTGLQASRDQSINKSKKHPK